MLIIFDLDDTLIDTSGCITPIQLRNAVEKLEELGLKFPCKATALEGLLRLNKTAPSARHALEEFFEINEIDSSYMPIAASTVYDEISSSIEVHAHDRAVQVLNALRETHKLALVTVGRSDLQLMKLQKAGIHSEIFSKIVVTQYKNKKIHYKSIVEELDMDPSEVIVCGDRISIDLTPAKELGYKTVHMLSGRGVYSQGNKGDVDYTISHLSEIAKILPQNFDIISLTINRQL